MRRRDPPPPTAMCVRCGWTGTPPHTPLRDEYGDVALWISQKACPRCGTPVVQLNAPPQSLPVQILTAVRETDLAPEDLAKLTRALRDSSPEDSPREVAERAQVPRASGLITLASKAGNDWIALLTLILTVVAIYMSATAMDEAHRDAATAIRQAHLDAERALAAERAATRPTSTLSDEDVKRIAEQLEQHLRHDR